MKRISEYRDYQELLIDLKKKYGIPEYPYFWDDRTYTPESRIKRGKEGLYLHHDKEDTYPQLSVARVNILNNYPFECHLPKNLTYANALEHLMLHILITLKDEGKGYPEVGINGLMIYMLPQINTYLAKSYQFKKEWLRKAMSIFDDEDTKEEYYRCLEYFLENYHGHRTEDHNFILRVLSPDFLVDNNMELFYAYNEPVYQRFKKYRKR